MGKEFYEILTKNREFPLTKNIGVEEVEEVLE
jgi:hypothetical protein